MAMSIARRAAEAWKDLTGEKGDFAATYAARVAWDSWGMRGRSIGDWPRSTCAAYDRDMHNTPTKPAATDDSRTRRHRQGSHQASPSARTLLALR